VTDAGSSLRDLFPRGIRYMVGAAFFFSLMSLFVKLAGRTLPTMEIVLARGVVIAVVTGGILRRRGIPAWGRRKGLLLLRGILGFVALTCFYFALVHLPLADATVIQYTNPAWTALLAAVFIDERLDRRESLGIVAALAGVVLIARPTFLFRPGQAALDPVWVGVALAGALFSAAAYVTVRQLGATEDPLVIVFYFALVNVVAAVPAAAPTAVWPSPEGWLLLGAVGVSTQVAQVMMTRGLKHERAGKAMAVAYLQIVFATLWGVLFLGEIPDLWVAGGAVLVIAGTWATGRRRS
jgi:drug/metabolite transporter (DMT)-like permease